MTGTFGRRVTRNFVILLVLLTLPVLAEACARPAPASPRASSPAGSATRTNAVSGPAATLDPSTLWYLVRGGATLDQGWAVDIDGDGNLYYATFQQADKELFTDIVVYKLAPDGTELWRARWGGPWQEKAFVVTVSGTRVYVGGCVYASANPTDADMVVLALNAQDGSLAWDFTWGQGYGYEEVDGLVVDGDALYLSGWTTGKTTGSDVGVLKLDRTGKLVWARSWGGNGWDEGDGQMVVDADTIYVAGRYNAANILVGGQGLLARFSKAAGDYLSHVAWDGPLGTDALGMTSDGTYLYTVGVTVDRGNGSQIQLRKYDKRLTLTWEQLWGGAKREDARAAAIGPAGDIFVAGASNSAPDAGGMDAVMLRFDVTGKLVWVRTWGGPNDEGIHTIAIFGDRAYLAGNSKSFGNGQQDDAILIRVDAVAGEFPALSSRK